jgi:hypothetical protein
MASTSFPSCSDLQKKINKFYVLLPYVLTHLLLFWAGVNMCNHTSNPVMCLHGLDMETFTFNLYFLTSCRGVAGWEGMSIAAAPGSRIQGATK